MPEISIFMKHGLRWVVGAAVLVWLGGCAGSPPSGNTAGNLPESCLSYETDIERVWSSETKANLAAAVRAQGTEVGGATGDVGWSTESYQRVTTGMDGASQDWSRMMMQLCSDVESERIEPDTYSARQGCLYQWLSNVRSALNQSDPGMEHEQVMELWRPVMQGTSECYSAQGS